MKQEYITKLQNFYKQRLITLPTKTVADLCAIKDILESLIKLPDEVYLPILHEVLKGQYESRVDGLGYSIIEHFQRRNIPIEGEKLFLQLAKKDCWNPMMLFDILVQIKYTDMILDIFEEESILASAMFKPGMGDRYISLVDLCVKQPISFTETVYLKAKTALENELEGKICYSNLFFDLLVRLLRTLSKEGVNVLEKMYNHKNINDLKRGIVEREMVLAVEPNFQETYLKIMEKGSHLHINEFILQNLYLMKYPAMSKVYKAIEKHKINNPRLYIKYISHQHQSNEINIVKAVEAVAAFIVELYKSEDIIEVEDNELKSAITSYFTNNIFHEELTIELIDKISLIPKERIVSYNRLIDSYVREWGINNKIRIF